tara:strand:- start:1734 stop:1946 length:213 start_codon:yes stop_codon:yes gene_type:complete
MITSKLAKGLIKLVVEHLFSKSKRFKAIYDYVHKPNNLDIDMLSVNMQLKELKECAKRLDELEKWRKNLK